MVVAMTEILGASIHLANAIVVTTLDLQPRIKLTYLILQLAFS